ncbi:MAG TPA: DUF58 domain-containing protein [Abditibacteriaceae bacterium]|nr:DUF58 domain-containing protein [Abditibacteriaceae bacterium]
MSKQRAIDGTAHYGVARRHLVSGWPSTSGSHDAAANAILNSAGLAGPWRFYTERLTVAGRWFLFATGAFLVSGLNSLELQAYVPLVYAFSLWLVALLIVLLSRPRVGLTTHHADRVCAGETLPVEVGIEAQGRRGFGLFGSELCVVPHRLPPVIDVVPAEGGLISVPAPHEKARARLGLKCHRRGVYRLQGFRVQTSFPLGLLRAYRAFVEERRLLVYPAFTPLARLEIPSGRRFHPGGVALASHLGDSFEFSGNREYREGDNWRDLDWRATARLNKPVVREYIEEYFLRVAVVLDTHLPPGAGDAQRAAFERAVSLCAAVGDYMASQEYIVDIFAAGPHLYHLTAGRGIAYLDQILDILACVEENPSEPFGALEPEILENLEQINTIICVFLDWNETRRAFLERLRGGGAGIMAIIVRDAPCTLDPDADRVLFGPLPVVSRAMFEAGIEEL